jgi:1-phosphatidylinositol-4-phosphate 5-kinase
MVFKAGQNAGASGSFFFFSHDRKFLIKTMRLDEMNSFFSMIKSYYKHVKNNRDSILARIYGVYTIKLFDIKPVHIMLMQNCMSISSAGESGSRLKIFDLKGSTFNRQVKKGKNTAGFVMKDFNFLLMKHNLDLNFTVSDRLNIINAIKNDT